MVTMKKTIYILSVVLIVFWVFIWLNSKPKFISDDDFIPQIQEDFVIIQHDAILNIDKNYLININIPKATIYTGIYESWSIIDESNTHKNQNILHNSKYDFYRSFYTYQTRDNKYLVFIAQPMFTQFGVLTRLGWWSLYVVELGTWKIKQIYIKELNTNRQFIDRIVWITKK